MKECSICQAQISDWETLCDTCWKRAKDSFHAQNLEDGNLISRLKGKAKMDLVDLIREICKACPNVNKGVDDAGCGKCAFKEKENLIRAFVE